MNRKKRRIAEKKEPLDPNAICKQALALQQLGQLDQAETLYKKALTIKPLPGAYNNLGALMEQENKYEEALHFFEKAREMEPDNIRYLTHVMKAAYRLGRSSHAAFALCGIIEQEPDNDLHKVHMAQIFKNITIETFSLRTKTIILMCLKNPAVNHQNMACVWAQIFSLDPELSKLWDMGKAASYDDFCKEAGLLVKTKLLKDPFLIEGLKKLMFVSAEMEFLLTYLRRYFLENTDKLEDHIELLNALAENNFTNEYVFSINPEEETACDALQKEIEAGDMNPVKLCVLASYRPLFTLKNAAKVSKHAPKSLAELMKSQIDDYKKERKLRKSIPALCDIEDEVSQNVQAMYEENPYPRWRAMERLCSISHSTPLKCLDAGCGTGRSSMPVALIYPKAHITAVDLSLASLAYAKRKAQEYGVKNIDFVHGDLLELEKIDDKFDFIYCTGVLHHIQNPMKGWRNLLSCLQPEGFMFICLYSELGRQDIVAARALIQERQYSPDTEGIRAFREDMHAVPDNNEVKRMLTKREDFYSLSECRDMCFHIQEKRYTIPELQNIFDELDLDFLGFNFTNPTRTQLYAKHFPEDPAMINLQNWNMLEMDNPVMFHNMYQFWCCRKGLVDPQTYNLQTLGMDTFYKNIKAH